VGVSGHSSRAVATLKLFCFPHPPTRPVREVLVEPRRKVLIQYVGSGGGDVSVGWAGVGVGVGDESRTDRNQRVHGMQCLARGVRMAAGVVYAARARGLQPRLGVAVDVMPDRPRRGRGRWRSTSGAAGAAVWVRLGGRGRRAVTTQRRRGRARGKRRRRRRRVWLLLLLLLAKERLQHVSGARRGPATLARCVRVLKGAGAMRGAG
jgi:hypothetical protein